MVAAVKAMAKVSDPVRSMRLTVLHDLACQIGLRLTGTDPLPKNGFEGCFETFHGRCWNQRVENVKNLLMPRVRR